ncbi:hypothetical protein KFE25_000253 [Diacronema lutheri]|uniref:Uncharacterized protein n=1 Tax=Diacronema lutheri TaxID=2081491 RepID=A0A8J5XIU3_DIALT|nr:hypothetical protein KFE25_000253 [Diacronema lutheri]|mmetsp:Transcript_5746/g.18068  ORF Transcript_5746/g.18068 Transcript_5746/m.18068 type:complete len:117 (-) Transcript_5746:165-515(-)
MAAIPFVPWRRGGSSLELIEDLVDTLDEASAWLPWITTALLGLVILYLLRERADRADPLPAPSATGAQFAEHTAHSNAALRAAGIAAGIHIDPRKFVHTMDECPLRGCSRCIRPKS